MEHQPLTQDEADRLLSAIDLSTATGLRNATLILLMIETGAKVGELVGKERSEGARVGGLRADDIDFRAGTVTLRRPKDHKERVMPLPAKLQQYLKALIESRPPQPDRDLVFVTRRGTALQSRYVRRILTEYARAARLDRDIRPSLLRRTFALGAYSRTRDVVSLRDQLGHSSTASSLRYIEEGDS
jgi:integrase